MKRSATYLMVAVLLTVFDAAETAYRAVAISNATSGDFWDCRFCALFAVLSATSLVSVWVQVIQNFGISHGDRCDWLKQRATLILGKSRGQDV